jgi:hypothetical protein
VERGCDLDFTIDELEIELMAVTGTDQSCHQAKSTPLIRNAGGQYDESMSTLFLNTSKSASSQPPTNGDALPQKHANSQQGWPGASGSSGFESSYNLALSPSVR